MFSDYSAASKLAFQLDRYLYDAPGSIFIKGVDGRYLYANKTCQDRIAGAATIIGSTDYELPWYEFAERVQAFDQMVLESDTMQRCTEPGMYYGGNIALFAKEKKPYYLDGQLVGIFGISVPCGFTENEFNNCNFINAKTNDMLTLTKKQKECLQYLIQGKTARETAEALNISVRTVEGHILGMRNTNNIGSLREFIRNIRVVR